MKTLPIRELEEARSNPHTYHGRFVGAVAPPDGRYGFFNALIDSIHRYHKRNDADEARAYLAGQLSIFKNEVRIEQTSDQLDWYIQTTEELGYPCVKSRQNIALTLPARAQQTVKSTGRVGRIDLVPSGGYAAWLFLNDEKDDWDKQLRMPLIQGAVAKLLGTDISQVKMGVYTFKDLELQSKTFSGLAIMKAERQLDLLLRSLGE